MATTPCCPEVQSRRVTTADSVLPRVHGAGWARGIGCSVGRAPPLRVLGWRLILLPSWDWGTPGAAGRGAPSAWCWLHMLRGPSPGLLTTLGGPVLAPSVLGPRGTQRGSFVERGRGPWPCLIQAGSPGPCPPGRVTTPRAPGGWHPEGGPLSGQFLFPYLVKVCYFHFVLMTQKAQRGEEMGPGAHSSHREGFLSCQGCLSLLPAEDPRGTSS